MKPRIREGLRETGQELLQIGARALRDPTAWLLVAANLFGAAAALTHRPVAATLFFLYWAECLLVGLLNVVKLWFVPIALGPEAQKHPVVRLCILAVGRTFLSVVFLFHYGFVLACCFVLIAGLSGEEARGSALPPSDPLGREFWSGLGLLAASHLFSLVWNFFRRHEYRTRTVSEQMIRPYSRVLLMFFTLVGGGLLVSLSGLPSILVGLFVLPKIALDLWAHGRDHGD